MKITTPQETQEILKQGLNSEFWKIIVEALKESKEHIQVMQDSEDIKDLPAEQYKLMNELYKAKKTYLDTLIKTPENLISWIEKPDNVNQDFDPYET